MEASGSVVFSEASYTEAAYGLSELLQPHNEVVFVLILCPFCLNPFHFII